MSFNCIKCTHSFINKIEYELHIINKCSSNIIFIQGISDGGSIANNKDVISGSNITFIQGISDGRSITNNKDIISGGNITFIQGISDGRSITNNKDIIDNNIIFIQGISDGRSISDNKIIIDNNNLKIGNIDNIKYTKPILKWVGGKTQIINNIISKFPKNIINYHEPFIGGGSILLGLLLLQENKLVSIAGKIYAYDINVSLINLYKNIQNNKETLYFLIKEYIVIYDSCVNFNGNKKPNNIDEAKSSKESYYYWLRKLYNDEPKTTIINSALLIIINKLCFRGMYRESSNGFNVPFGNYKKTPSVIDKEHLDIVSNLIKNVEFICQDFETSFNNFKEGDFIYMDPPYMTDNEKSFVNYNTEGFNLDKHNKLFNLTNNLNKDKIKFVLSNAKTDYIINMFKHLYIEEIVCKRSINSKNPGDKAIELIIYN
jgi:DNA adenine methylase